MPNLDIRQSEGLKKLNLLQCGTHGKLFSAKNPDATCPQCGPDSLAATQLIKSTMGLMPADFKPTAQKRAGTKKAAAKPAAEPSPAAPADEIPAGMKRCRSGKHIIDISAPRCLPCNNEASKARREAKKAGAAK